MGQFQTKVEQEGTFTELHYCPTGKNHKKTSMLTKMKYRELGCSVVIGSSLKGQLYKKTHTHSSNAYSRPGFLYTAWSTKF